MTRVYTKPKFNLTGRVWFHALPDDLTLWSGDPPTTPPNATFACQLYYPRWGLYRWLHALSDSCFKSLLNAGVQELRYDLATDLKAPWGVSTVSRWSDVPLCEVPVGSGRLYAVVLQEAKHLGFVNQYAVAILAQLGAIPPGPPPPPPSFREWATGSAIRSRNNVTPATPDLATGGAIEAVIVLPPIRADIATGSGLVALVVAGYAIVSGGAIASTGSAGTFLASLGEGSALDGGTTIPTSYAARLGSGSAETDQELFPSRRVSIATGEAIAGVKVPPGVGQSIASGGALEGKVGNLIKRNPCATVGTPVNILLTCTSQTGTLTGWVGATVTCTYNSGAGNWQGTLTKGGHSGTITITSVASSVMNFSGSSSTFWTVSTALSNDTISCGPPFSGTSGNHNTTEGLNTGNTVWTYA